MGGCTSAQKLPDERQDRLTPEAVVVSVEAQGSNDPPNNRGSFASYQQDASGAWLPTAHPAPVGVWTCRVDGGQWEKYSDAIRKQLEQAYNSKERKVVFFRGGIRYVADLRRMVQVRADGTSKDERPIRRSLLVQS